MTPFEFSWRDDDNDSELTELSDSDEEPEPEPEPTPPVVTPTPKSEVRPTKTTRPSTQQATKQSRDRSGAKSLPYLKSPRTTTYSLSSLHEWMTSGTIDLDPEYQRAVVWSTQKQESLIDSFYHNFYVPPIIFATTIREEDGTEIRTCIDGKQRLTSMRLFMNGELSHKNSVTGNRSWFSNPKGSKRRLITPQWQSKFKNTQIACVEYDGITEEQQREIFQRVQMGVTLTPADRLQAVNGPIADLIRDIRIRINSTEGFEGYLDWGKARGKDFKALAEIAYLITHAKTVKSQPTLARLETFLDNKTHPVLAAKRREGHLVTLRSAMPNVMDIFCRIVRQQEHGKSLRNNLSPLEFVMSAYLVFLYRKKLSDFQLSQAIGHMREDANSLFKDMKLDAVKCEHFLTFIHKKMIKVIPCLKADDEDPAFQIPFESKSRDRLNDSQVDDTTPATSKRKRKDAKDADSDDEASQVKKRKVKRNQSKSVSDIGPDEKAIAPKPRAPKSRPSLNVSRSSAPVGKAQTTIKRTPVEQQSQLSHIKKPTHSQPMPVNKSEGLQVANPSVKPLPSRRIVSGISQQVISKLGPQSFEPVPLGRRAEAARTLVLNHHTPTGPVIPATQTQVASTSSLQRGPPPPGRHRSLNLSGNSPVVQQHTLPPLVQSTSPGTNKSAPGSVMPSDASSTSQITCNHSTRMRAGHGRLGPVYSAKAATSSGTTSVTGSTPNPDLPQVPRPGSVGPHPATMTVSTLETSSTIVDDADMRWQMGFASLLPTHNRTTENYTQMSRIEPVALVSSRMLAPVDRSTTTSDDVIVHDVEKPSKSIDGSLNHCHRLPTPTSSPSTQPGGQAQNLNAVPERR